MVEETITDGTRIAELLASELAGLAVGPLATVAVVDAEPDATPSDAGTYAYGISADEERIAEVRIRPESAVIHLDGDWGEAVPADGDGLSIDGGDLVIERGASVKRAVDVLRRRLDG